MNKAFIIFEINGRRYEYDGGTPESLDAIVAPHLDAWGFWRDRPDLSAQGKDDSDTLPDARWEIERIGGRVVEVHGARENGAIHLEDWKTPRIF